MTKNDIASHWIGVLHFTCERWKLFQGISRVRSVVVGYAPKQHWCRGCTLRHELGEMCLRNRMRNAMLRTILHNHYGLRLRGVCCRDFQPQLRWCNSSMQRTCAVPRNRMLWVFPICQMPVAITVLCEKKYHSIVFNQFSLCKMNVVCWPSICIHRISSYYKAILRMRTFLELPLILYLLAGALPFFWASFGVTISLFPLRNLPTLVKLITQVNVTVPF